MNRQHTYWLMAFIALMLGHWAEHVVQMYQVYGMCIPRKQALGLFGKMWPWLITGEWMHTGYAILTLSGLVLLRYGFSGQARKWWNVAIGISIWHLGEHLLLFGQAQGIFTFFGHGEYNPTSVIQMVFPQMRVELHFFYNSIVTIPMVTSMIFHFKKNKAEVGIFATA